MATRYTQRRRELGRRQAQKRFERQRRLNRMAAPGPHPLVFIRQRMEP